MGPEVRLLRQSLHPSATSPCEDLDHLWSPAQPEDTLSPLSAADCLGVGLWAPASAVAERYRELQKLYPPEQYMEEHTHWRPACELLGNPTDRLDWFWRSGSMPEDDLCTPARAASVLEILAKKRL
jgi:hypothetical protein